MTLAVTATAPAHSELWLYEPDPVMTNGKRYTSFANWELRRNQIKTAIEKYEIGPKPDCSDCTVTANYEPPVEGSAKGTLTVVVTQKGESLTLTCFRMPTFPRWESRRATQSQAVPALRRPIPRILSMWNSPAA
jgi:hypothetical protein